MGDKNPAPAPDPAPPSDPAPALAAPAPAPAPAAPEPAPSTETTFLSEAVSLPDYDTFTYKDQMRDILSKIKLTNPVDNSIIMNRFLNEVLFYEKKRDDTRKYYNTFRFIVTVGSIILPALLSVGQMDPVKLPANFDIISYWSSWGISLSVTISNGFLQLFSLDKNYFEYSLTTEQLKTEGWQFCELSGKYEDFTTHILAYKTFCKSIENIKRKQIEKEFSGKADIKKKKEFNFQEELMKNLPDLYKEQLSKEDKLVEKLKEVV
jgi:hypothetical protein